MPVRQCVFSVSGQRLEEKLTVRNGVVYIPNKDERYTPQSLEILQTENRKLVSV